jgi:adenylate cyclase
MMLVAITIERATWVWLQLRWRAQPSMAGYTEVVEWLIDGAQPASETREVVSGLCERLVDSGIPVWRFGLFVLTLHPQIMGQAFLWKPGADVDVVSASFETFKTEAFRQSPVRRVIDTRAPLRRKLEETSCPMDFEVTRDLRVQGATDYLAVPLLFARGAVHGATFATRQPGGFTDEQIAVIESIVGPLARVVENRLLERTASILLDTYVGKNAGSRILAGQIRRGDTDAIRAAIWLSDMRGFTSLADRLPPQTLVDMLNQYFDRQVPAIVKHGGEVLKFIGDGLLAIFPIASGDEDAQEVCENALAAAHEARTAIASDLNEGGVRFGLALHVGEVLYGNIGSGNRLDFTCIGPAVNLAARIEKLTGEMKRTILASDEFVRYCSSQFLPVGEFELRGFGVARSIFGLADEQAGLA